MAHECVDRLRVADGRLAANDGDRHGVRVLLRHVGGFVVAGVVVHDDLVFARKLGEHRSEPPEQDANGGDLVVRGDGEEEHRAGRKDEATIG